MFSVELCFLKLPAIKIDPQRILITDIMKIIYIKFASICFHSNLLIKFHKLIEAINLAIVPFYAIFRKIK